jgi:hypothetical protein
MASPKKTIPGKEVSSSKSTPAKKVASTKSTPAKEVSSSKSTPAKKVPDTKSNFNKIPGTDAFVVFVENANKLVTYCYHSEFNKEDKRNTYLATKATVEEAHKFALDYAKENNFTPQYT